MEGTTDGDSEMQETTASDPLQGSTSYIPLKMPANVVADSNAESDVDDMDTDADVSPHHQSTNSEPDDEWDYPIRDILGFRRDSSGENETEILVEWLSGGLQWVPQSVLKHFQELDDFMEELFDAIGEE